MRDPMARLTIAALLAALALPQAATAQDGRVVVTHVDNIPPAPQHDDGETLWPQEAVTDGVLYTLYTPQFESIVGTSGNSGDRFRVEMPIARSRVLRTWVTAPGMVAIMKSICPAITSVNAGPAPL